MSNISDKKDDGIWIRFWMESGRGHSTIRETYEYLKYEDGFVKEEYYEYLAYDWAYDYMRGRDLMRFTSGFELVEKPPKEWLIKELDSVMNRERELAKYKTLLNKMLEEDFV